jgi:hypothetical protein
MDPRELIRLAQADEVAGNDAAAAERLRRAATLYREQGKDARAEQLERHASRLTSNEKTVLRSALTPPAGPNDVRSRTTLPEQEAAASPQRGPTRADPATDAWCSFCCRPDDEVGALIASPTGAFLCRGCAEESLTMLAGPPRPSASSDLPELLENQARAYQELEVAIALGARAILLLAAEGSGTTTALQALARKGAGEYVRARELLRQWVHSRELFIDDADLLSQEELETLAARLVDREFVLALHGELPGAAVELTSNGRKARVNSTSELKSATRGRLPLFLLERFDAVVVLPPLDEPALRQIAARAAAKLGRTPAPAVLDRLVAEAMQSGRGAHELIAMLRRHPRGEWTLR